MPVAAQLRARAGRGRESQIAVRRLEQQQSRVAAEPEPRARIRVERGQPVERDLAAAPHLDRDPRIFARPPRTRASASSISSA